MPIRSTISADYLAQQQELHKNPKYGVASLAAAPLVKQFLEEFGATSLSDYGAGKCNLRLGLHQLGKTDFEYFPYDPAFPEYGDCKPADLVCCIDVLEHIEPEYLDVVMLDLKEITRKYGFFSIDIQPAIKKLPDGRNAHLIQKPTSWWLPTLCQHFEVAHLQSRHNGFWVVVVPRMPS
jgi:hypothetical protein